MVAANSAPNPEVRGASCEIITLPVFLTDCKKQQLLINNWFTTKKLMPKNS